MQNTPSINPISIILHWLVALIMIGQLILGMVMIEKFYSFYELHKSVGILSLLLILPRVIWRLWQGWPTPLSLQIGLEQKIAKWVHWGLLLGTLVMPLSGMLASGASGHGFGLFSLVALVPENHSLLNPGEVEPYSQLWMNVGYTVHSWAGYLLSAAIFLHITAALKHHLFDKDDTFRRMLAR